MRPVKSSETLVDCEKLFSITHLSLVNLKEQNIKLNLCFTFVA